MTNTDHLFFIKDKREMFKPLKIKFPDRIVKDFKYMHSLKRVAGKDLHFYKHYATQKYIRVDNEGHCYNKHYNKVLPFEAMKEACGTFYAGVICK